MPFSLDEYLDIVPQCDLYRTWPANRTLMCLKVSKKTTEKIMKLCLPIELVSNYRFFMNVFHSNNRCRHNEDKEKLEFMINKIEKLSTICIIKKLKLRGCKIDKIMFKLYEIIKKNKFLEILDISYNQISSRQAVYLAKYIKECSMLKELILENNEICDGVKSIIEMLPLSVTHLNLNSNGLCDSGAIIIGKMHNRLTHLDLNSNCITDIGVESLIEGFVQPQFSSLTNLDIRGNLISDEGKAKLATVVGPQCTIQMYFEGRW
jgi:Ran GTPase-activating protein (RanGAP) involved in mRNA processing and transport